ncbi:restriction endonuclease subunit S [Eikenella corrodens]|uniref:restriction endonuclease subunit S n=1 Tax=Eikenella corrodens TaxID=539 RepID=UPI00129B840D|nr:restriction endonuclease subunit S [Eikenella corrodens]
MNKQQEPRLRFQGFTGAWEEKKLGDMADIVRGASPRPIQDPKWFDDSSDIGWLRISDVTTQNGRIHYLEQKISKAGQEKTRVIETPHLLLSIAASVGKPVINYVKTGVHDGFLVFKNPNFELEFMFQYLDSFVDTWQSYGQPGTQVNLNSNIVKNTEFLVPTLPEQTHLGLFFHRLDSQIAESRAALDKIRQLKKAMLAKMFPANGEKIPKIRFKGFEGEWECRKLGIEVEIIGGGTPDTTNSTYWNGDIDWYSPTEIGEAAYANGSVKKITLLGLQKSSAQILPANRTVLFTSRASIGDMAILTKDGATNQGFQSFVVGERLDVYFLYTMGFKIKDYALKNASGSTFLEISKNTLSQMEFFAPSLKEQTAIGLFFRQLDETIALQSAEVEKLNQLKKGLLAAMLV